MPSTDSVNSLPSEAPSNEGASDRPTCGCSNCGCSSAPVNVYLSEEEDDDWGKDIAPLGYRRVQRQELFESALLQLLDAVEHKVDTWLQKLQVKLEAKKQSNK